MKVSFADRVDETAAHCNIQVPDHNSFEGWNDYQPGPGVYYVAQPTINPLFNTRQMQQSLLTWLQDSEEWHDYIRNYWESNILRSEEHTSELQSLMRISYAVFCLK